MARRLASGFGRALALAAALSATAPAFAPASAEVKAIGRFRDWTVYTETRGREQICYAAVSASDKAPKSSNHGDVVFYVATWKSGSAANQPSMKVGYELRNDIAPEAVIGNQRFRMYAAGSEAFVPDDRERALVEALKRGSELRVEAASRSDARTAYHFSLSGSSDAIDRARALCR